MLWDIPDTLSTWIICTTKHIYHPGKALASAWASYQVFNVRLQCHNPGHCVTKPLSLPGKCGDPPSLSLLWAAIRGRSQNLLLSRHRTVTPNSQEREGSPRFMTRPPPETEIHPQ